MFTITIDVQDQNDHPEALGLLVPRAFDTPYQTFRGVSWPEDWTARELTEGVTGQSAVLLSGGTRSPVLRYLFTTPGPPDSAGTYESPKNRYTTAAPELMAEIQTLIGDDHRDSARRIVAHTFERFEYGHTDEKFYEGHDAVPAIACGTVKGSCVDINTYLISSFATAEIPSVYFAGYFFPEERGGITNDMHCWVTSWAGGERQDWDIAHHMKLGRTRVDPAYNPKPGMRFALTYGRGLVFVIDEVEVELSHFSEPRWVYPDGTAALARIEARLNPSSE